MLHVVGKINDILKTILHNSGSYPSTEHTWRRCPLPSVSIRLLSKAEVLREQYYKRWCIILFI